MHETATSSKATRVQKKPRSYEQGEMPPFPARRVASRRAFVGSDARRRVLRNPDSPPKTNKGPEGRGGPLPFPPCPCKSPPRTHAEFFNTLLGGFHAGARLAGDAGVRDHLGQVAAILPTMILEAL